jgi:hypothetical protein
MARSARTKRTTASAPPPASDSSDNDDDRSGDADDTETNEDASDPEDPEPRPEVAGPAREPVTHFTMLRELTRDYYETVIGLNKTASYALFVDQRMQSIRDFLRIKPEHIEKICTAISKQNKTNIPVMAMERLALSRTMRNTRNEHHAKIRISPTSQATILMALLTIWRSSSTGTRKIRPPK